MRLGYACQNLTLPATTNHTMRQASLARVRVSVEQNLVDLERMVLHLGGAYGEHAGTRARFVGVLRAEPDLPVVVDNLHHRLNPGGVTLAEALRLARPTWAGQRQKVHLSSQKAGAAAGAHADFIDPADLHELLEAWGSDDPLDVMVEAKAKDRAALALLQ